MISKKTFALLLSIVGGLVFWILAIAIASITDDPDLAEPTLINRLFVMVGGSFPSGIIQAVTMMFFLYGLITLLMHRKDIIQEQTSFKLNLLPTGEQKILDPKQVNEIKLKMIELEQQGQSYQLISLIKKACTQYRNEGSISDTLQVIDHQVEAMQEQSQSNYDILHYLAQGIPSLGFLGTVLGISGAIGKFYLATDFSKLPQITSMLNIAFDTTFFSLFLGLILTYVFNRTQDNENKFYTRMREYVIDNLVSRIFHGGVKNA
ncbi:MotA/TolQ/ExbB proton channel family protein [Haliscomenobacter hydrossis]|uniref:MotA/TolQ/ExbB proton channel domain-containing protein n=1 Tax=Haliscomenobacter hydrossis (strain ATCC 27775 / DSM 1100 / LMG 10767 / O) TaxID=760192 RepID=F4KUL1_HALH1|nr:MotA/TolQ/ExbB proton channel family protein [Haliscomenobacter hydrossis]AEE52447.1 hypothetical protein Halhy_4610 [Haliscomenobacter hydrossis DSM 1100]